MDSKKKILIMYDWFFPGFKAGGPIQSLTNLTSLLRSNYDVFVITSAYDLNSKKHYSDIKIDSWNNVVIPVFEVAIKVFYASKTSLNKNLFKQLVTAIAPCFIYFNGIFSYKYFLLPLQTLKEVDISIKIIICPRGMLKDGALSGKWIKKKIYLKYLKVSGLIKNVFWHATSANEAMEITFQFPTNQGISIAPNIPKAPTNTISFITKTEGQLRLVYLALINEHKNLLLLLELIQVLKGNITLDIYGPIVDESYWNKCNFLIQEMPLKAQYRGVVEPIEVQAILSKYDASILLTKGENFSHSIYESFSVGRPVITSYFTPWQDLFKKKVGANVDINDKNDCINKINFLASTSTEDYQKLCSSAHQYALNYYSNLNPLEKYNQLFS